MATPPVPPRSVGRKIRPITVDGDIARVPLTRGYTAIIDAADVPLVERHNWYALVTKTGHVYAVRGQVVDGKQTAVLMHRQLLSPPAEMDVDHIDGDGLNNRRANMRVCTHQQNMANQYVTRRNRLALKGVSMRAGRYRATIQVNDRRIELGVYATPEEAAAAYKGAARALHGEFANAA